MSSYSYEKQLENSRLWKKANPERHAELARAYRKRNKEKTYAQNQLNYAVRTGTLRRMPCEGCGTTEKVHAHHDDYSKPLDVKWLCYLCHKKSHPVSERDKKVKFAGYKPARLFGEDNPNSKITSKESSEINVLLDAGLSQGKIAKLYGVQQTTISRIKLKKRQKEKP